ncbi:porin [Aquincola sp. S2]|uniref:Porin n=1 Tax=Pseudaquabacterium terrae TaxID=2732868 RepID=A0ABX2ENG8_9BURK|nr:porin [Aquabacterium terrae]NRF70245.1 porin [Aquabacterium terrae]
MHPTRFVLACVLAAAGATAAQAQSNATLYGRVDLGYRHDSGGVRQQIANNSMNAVGFRGVEELGDGLQAFFQIEHRFDADTGLPRTPFWDEISIVGLRGAYGELRLGRQGGPFGVAPDQDAFGGDTVAGAGERKAGADDKYNNSVVYWTPAAGGFSAAVGVSAGEGLQRRGASAVLRYAQGPLLAMVSYADRSNRDHAWAAGGIHDFGAAKLILAAAHNDGDASGKERTTFDLGTIVPLGRGSLRAKLNHDDNDGVKTRNFGLGYWHDLSARTLLYSDIGLQKTDGLERVRRFDFGIRHNF